MITEYQSAIDDLTVLLDDILTVATDDFERLYPEGTNLQHLYSVALLASITELGISIAREASSGRYSVVPIALRALVECYIDLLNLLADSDYVKYIFATHFKEQGRFIKTDYPSITKHPFYSKHKNEVSEYVRALQEEGVRPLTVEEKFTGANKALAYRSLYWLLCQDSHNDVSVLEERHIREEDGVVTVRLFVTPQRSYIARYLLTTAGYVLEGWIHTTRLLRKYDAAKWERFLPRLERAQVVIRDGDRSRGLRDYGEDPDADS